MKTKIQPVALVAPKTSKTFGIAICESENHPKIWWVIYLLDWKKGKVTVHTACEPFEEKDLRAIKVISPEEEPALFQTIKTVKHPNQLHNLLDMEVIIKRHVPKQSEKRTGFSLPFTFASLMSSLKG